jgi:hypothetical protein
VEEMFGDPLKKGGNKKLVDGNSLSEVFPTEGRYKDGGVEKMEFSSEEKEEEEEEEEEEEGADENIEEEEEEEEEEEGVDEENIEEEEKEEEEGDWSTSVVLEDGDNEGLFNKPFPSIF